ncbi:helix-turn-helix domain-containing protein [Streptomyces sp. NPDC056534]|uniref:helix-turn-helix domain-containing protein n=1 Tax=Streptomyces sp. NPDC056534 TaxID=3345857 RepID=UPI0036ADD63D
MYQISRQRPLRGSERTQVASALRAKYEAGASIRALAGATHRSYGAVHKLLLEAGATLRPRGNQRKPAETDEGPCSCWGCPA